MLMCWRPWTLTSLPSTSQRLVQRDGLQVFDGHFFGEGDDVAELVHLAHGVVEDGGDDAAVAVAGRSGVALRRRKWQTKVWRSSSRVNLRRMPSGLFWPQAKQ